MSRYRRQSYYLAAKRKSAAPILNNLQMGRLSEEELEDDAGTVVGITPPILGSNLLTASPLRTVQSTIPPPNLESMKVIRGFEFVTFTPTSLHLSLNFEKPPTLPSSAFASSSGSPEPTKSVISSTSSSSLGPSDRETMVKTFEPERLPSEMVTALGEVSEAQARQSLYEYADAKFCYGTKAALRMTIRDMFHSYVFEYSLESYCERRQVCWAYEPYSEGGHNYLPLEAPIKTGHDMSTEVKTSCLQKHPSQSLPPNAWTIEIDELANLKAQFRHRLEARLTPKSSPTTSTPEPSMSPPPPISSVDLFRNRQYEAIVPGTLSIVSCHYCGGVGRKRCATCNGSGSKTCATCFGNGYYYGYQHKSTIAKTFETGDYCWRCHGRGRLRCFNCNGEAMATCIGCFGSGQIKCYIKLIVTLTNHKDTVLIKDQYSQEIPGNMLSTAEGDWIFEEEGHNAASIVRALANQLSQVTNYIDDSLARESERLIGKHSDHYLSNSRPLLQRHRIRVIPVAKVAAYWQRKQFHFYVFGTQHACYSNNYPQRYTCCPCCCIV